MSSIVGPFAELVLPASSASGERDTGPAAASWSCSSITTESPGLPCGNTAVASSSTS